MAQEAQRLVRGYSRREIALTQAITKAAIDKALDKAPHRKKKVSRQDVVQEVVRMVEVAMEARLAGRSHAQIMCVLAPQLREWEARVKQYLAALEGK